MRIRDSLELGVSTYQDVKGLHKLLEDFSPHVRRINVVDGVYDGFKLESTDSPYSTDGTQELCKQYKNVNYIQYYGYQPDKRQKYVDAAAQNKASVLFIVDSDEWVHPDYQDWDKFYDKLEDEIETWGRFHNVWNCMTYVQADYELARNAVTRDAWQVCAGRLWYKPEELEYYGGVHYWVRKRQTTDPYERLMTTDKMIDEGVRLTTSTKLRNQEFRDARDKWAQWGLEYENRLIETYQQAVQRGVWKNPDRVVTYIKPIYLYPLIAILQKYKLPEREKGITRTNNYADILFIRYEKDYVEALQTALDYFKKHRGYTHLALTEFEVNWSEKEYRTLSKMVKERDNPILSGFTYEKEHKDMLTREANFKLPARNTVHEEDLNPNATYMDIQQYLMLYRQNTVVVDSVSDMNMTFVRNDIVGFLGNLDGMTISEKLKNMGIPQYVHLECPLDRIVLSEKTPDVTVNKELRADLITGTYR